MNISLHNMSKNTISIDLEKLNMEERETLFSLLQKGQPDITHSADEPAKTQTEDFQIDKQKLIEELQAIAEKEKYNNGSIAWALYYDKTANLIGICPTRPYMGGLSFSSYEQANEAIEIVGANKIKKFIFEVQDDEEL